MTGLVLAGGGVKGSYQIGAYLALKKCHIKINGVVGTSIGSFNGALICSGQEDILYDFWHNASIGKILNFQDKYIESVNNEDKFKEFIYGLEEITHVIMNKGISNDNMRNILKELIDENKIRKSKMDYGLVTVNMSDLKPLCIFKKDMKQGKIVDYILASCNLPVFKSSKYIDNKYYIDGGFYDNNPVNMLIDAGYDKIYSIEVQGIGIYKKIKDKSKVIKITPSRFLGSTLNVNKSKINENIKLGYYDTLKLIKNYDGYNFIFHKHYNFWYNMLTRRVEDEKLARVKKYFNVSSNKEVILKCLEYIMVKESMTYFKIYNIFDLIKDIKKYTKSKHFVYEFIRNLSMF